MPVGRPSSYTPEKAAIICERLSDGESLRAICKDPNLPSIPSFFRWLEANPEFREQYVRARETQADVYAAEIVELSDNCRIGAKTEETIGEDGKTSVKTITADMIERSRLQIDARKWAASKLAPKKYGERLQTALTDADGNAAGFIFGIIGGPPKQIEDK